MSDFKSSETATANVPPIYPDEKRPQKATAHSVSVDDYPEEPPPEYSAIFNNPPTSSYEVKYKDWKCTTASFIDATSNNKEYLADLPSFIHGRIKLRSAHTSDEVLGRSNVWKPKKNISATYRGTDLQMKYQSLLKLNYPWVSTVSLPTSSSSQPVVSNSKLFSNDLVPDTASDAGSDADSDKEHIHGVSDGANMKWQYRGDFGKLGNMEYVLFRTDGNADTSRETINEPLARWRVQGPKVGPFKDLGRVEIFGEMSREQKEEVFLTGLTAVYIEIVARSNATLGSSAIGTMVAVGKGEGKK